MYHNLPIDIINIILLYDGTIKFRNGKYMNQIEKEDPRYDLLNKVQKPDILYICPSEELYGVHLSKFFLLKHVDNYTSSITVSYIKDVGFIWKIIYFLISGIQYLCEDGYPLVLYLGTCLYISL